MLATAIELRTLVRDYLQCDPPERRRNKDAVRALNKTLDLFPLVVAAGDDGGLVVTNCRRARRRFQTRRWCMSSLCGNRMKTRSYRERQRNTE